MSVKCDIVSPNLVDQVWPDLANGMIKSCRNTGGSLTPGYLWQECRSGHAFLVVAYEDDKSKLLGACIVRFQNEGDRKVLRGLGLCGTQLKLWLEPMRKKVNEMAKQGGAVAFVDEGRMGMTRLIEGAQIRRVTYEVEIK
ncbi:MAG: hypothetical protein GY807_20530 [Gammaproteobacteria bacterium]|nr:hypothetical protein [Gammaproteobacteria bacterium]